MEVGFANPSVLAECLEFVKDIVRRSGTIVREGFLNRTMKVETKTAFFDLVTEYDRRTEEFLMAAIQAKYPGHKYGSRSNRIDEEAHAINLSYSFTGLSRRRLVQPARKRTC